MFPLSTFSTMRLVAVAVAVLAAFGLYKYVQNLKSTIKELESSNTELTTKLNTQNNAIRQMAADAALRQETFKTALEEADRKVAEAKTKSIVYYKAKPSTPNDSCKSALDLINGGAK